MKRLSLYSWNVNGIRAAVRNGFTDFLKKQKPDIIGLQEVKIDSATRAKTTFDFAEYDEHWNPAERPGYSGTATLVLSKLASKPLKATMGIGEKRFDDEGRIQTLEFEKFYFVNAYFPNSAEELVRLPYKLAFNKAFLAYVKKLERKKPVIFCGDLNVAHKEIDLKNPKSNAENAGFTPQEREGMDAFIKAGFADTFRHLHPNTIQYSWWTYRFQARARNVGWRIDYFLVSSKLLPKIKKAFILDSVLGSDHCPVGIELAL
ncbi:MAG: exodeoxyribonuclease III [Candidatus Komeilibacteria bacterium]|nr:exodeoxyribonuclease III [Candidatus Komeilibacteria bacterium]